MEVKDLYTFVLGIVLVGMLLGIGLTVLSKLMTSGAETVSMNETVNGAITAIAPIATTWLSLIVTVAVLAIVLTLVIRSFATGGRGK